MIRLSTRQKVRVALTAFLCIQFGSVSRCLAQRRNEEAKVLRLSPAPAADVAVRRDLPSTIVWNGRRYETSEGIEVLTRISTDDLTGPKERESALVKLGTVAPSLHRTAHLPKLIALYERLTQQNEKRALIGCIAESDDLRGLPLFAKVLSDATDEIDRFQAAYALARWNVRQGVRELIGLLEFPEVGPEGQRFTDTVLKVLERLNRQRGWGIPDHDILERIAENDPHLTQEQKLSLYIAAIKEWFAENEHRFPDWKAGDPLPEVEEPQKGNRGDK